MRKETPAKKLADAVAQAEQYRQVAEQTNQALVNESLRHYKLQIDYSRLKTKYTLAMLDKEALGAKLSAHPWRLAEAALDLAQERLRHQATKRLIPLVAFVASVIGAVLLTAFMWLTRWAP